MIKETNVGRLITDESATEEWTTVDEGDELASRDALEAELPSVFNGMVIDDVSMIKRHRSGVYRWRVSWVIPEKKKPDPVPEGEWTFSLDTTGGTARIKQSFDTKAFNASGRDAGSDDLHEHAVLVTGSGVNQRVEGADIVIPALQFAMKATLPETKLGISYAILAAKLTGKVNDAQFPPNNMPFVDQQFAAGEVLFKGATGERHKSGSTTMTLKFEASQNVTGLTSGSITDIEKKGHEFIWYRYKPKDKAANKATVVEADLAFVETLYQEANFLPLLV